VVTWNFSTWWQVTFSALGFLQTNYIRIFILDKSQASFLQKKIEQNYDICIMIRKKKLNYLVDLNINSALTLQIKEIEFSSCH